MHVLRDGGGSVKCNRCPCLGDVLVSDPMAAQEVARGICSINFKTVCRAAVSRHQTDVVEHSSGVEKFGIELEATALACEGAEVVDATGMIEQQTRFCVADEFRDFIGKFAVGNADAPDKWCLRSLGCCSHDASCVFCLHIQPRTRSVRTPRQDCSNLGHCSFTTLPPSRVCS